MGDDEALASVPGTQDLSDEREGVLSVPVSSGTAKSCGPQSSVLGPGCTVGALAQTTNWLCQISLFMFEANS